MPCKTNWDPCLLLFFSPACLAPNAGCPALPCPEESEKTPVSQPPPREETEREKSCP